MSEQSDSELILLSQQRDKAAFGQLVSRYQSMAQRLAVRVTGQEDLAQDLVQEALLQAYLSIDKLHDPTRFRSWLYGIVLNVCRNDWRRRKIVGFSLETMIGNPTERSTLLVDSSLDPQQMAERAEIHAALQKAVETLSHKNRSATVLFYHEQLSLTEVASRLNISVNAVKGRLHKSRHQLRAQLSPMQTNLLSEFMPMPTETPTQARPNLCCSFCGKNNQQVRSLIAGPLLDKVRIYICDECVDVCNRIISGETPPLTQAEVETLMDSGS